MADLRALLELATDEIEGFDAAHMALASARQRRNRRRGVVAVVASGVVVAGVLVVPRVVDGSSSTLPDGPATSSPSQTGEPTPEPSPTEAVAPSIRDDVVQPVWDPSTAEKLPRYPIGHIPTALAPVGGHSRPGDTEGVLVLARDDDDRLAVLYGERGFYGQKRFSGAGDIVDSALSRDGSTLAIVGERGLFWCPAAEECPSWTRVELPDLSDPAITWTRDADHLIVAGYETAYLVDLGTGELTELPFLGDYASFDVAPDGRIVSSDPDPRSLSEWDADQQAARVLTGDLGGLGDVVVSEDLVAATRADIVDGEPREPSDDDGDGLVVLDRDDLTTLAFLPFTGRSGEWVDADQVRPLQWLDASTVLPAAQLDGRGRHGSHR